MIPRGGVTICYTLFMLLQTKIQKIASSLLAILLLVTTGKDWFDFYTCGGAVGTCLSDAGLLQLYTKFAMSVMLTVLAFATASNAFCARDAKFLRVAFIFSLLADFSFSMIKAIAPDAGAVSTVLGIVFFMLFQTVLIYRHTRTSESDKSLPKVYGLLVVALVAAVVLIATNVVGLTVAVVIAYAVFLITSVVMGILAPGKGFFPAENAKFVRIGMIVWFFGDALVGLSMVSGDDHSALQMVATLANNFIWWVYVPSQLLVIRSCVKPKA